ncbi:hypothetical protein ACN95_03230 [Gordonia sihwensis]|nr:hypothetical protein [Gordonia sihwensis]
MNGGFWRRGGEEGIIERTVKTYFLSAIAVAVALIALFAWYIDTSLVWWGSLATSAALLGWLAYEGGDAVLELWWRWPIVAKDVGLVANESGVPDLLWVTADRQKCTAVISALAFSTMDAIEMEDRIAQGFGYRAGVIKEVAGRWRKSRVRWQLSLFRVNVMESVIPVRFHDGSDMDSGSVFLGCDKTLEPITLDLLDTAGHWIVQGSTRSGKTAFIYGVLAQAASMRNVVCRIVDPTGIIALPFSAFDPHSVAPEPGSTGDERFSQVADFLDNEVHQMDLRIAELTRSWRDKIDQTTPEEPLRLIVIEEYAGVLEAAAAEDAKAGRKKNTTPARIESSLARLTAEGAKAAVRVVLMTQRASSQVLNTDTRGNFAVRISFKVEAKESLNMLHDDLGPEWVQEIKKYKNGVGVVQLPGEEIRKFRAGLLGEPGDSIFEEFTRQILGSLEVSQSAQLERAQVEVLEELLTTDSEEETADG